MGGLVWIILSVILTGYPLYPLPVLSMPVDWRLPFVYAKSNYDGIHWYAIAFGQNYNTLLASRPPIWKWFGPWLHAQLNLIPSNRTHIVGLTIAFIVFVLGAFAWFRCFLKQKKRSKLYFFFLWTFVNIIYWLFSAPDIRFGSVFFWIFFGMALNILFADDSAYHFYGLLKNIKIKCLFSLFCYCIVIICIVITIRSPKKSLLYVGKLLPSSYHTEVVGLINQFKINIPDDNNPRNTPIPATTRSILIPGLEMRVPGNLGKGFRIVN
jgi:hypothetical protein